MSTTISLIVLCVSFVLLLLLRFPVSLVLALSSLLTAMTLDLPLPNIALRMVHGIDSYSLLAIPFFILAGQIMSEGGLALRLVNLAQLIVGAIRGGLAMVNCLACMLFGNISGSAAADVSSVGSVMIPMMKKKNYEPNFSVAVTSAAAIQGVVMPPSHNMIIYAVAAGGVSISSLFLAGVIPCLIMLVALMATSYIIARKRGYPKGEPVKLKDVPKILIDGFLSLMTGVVILGGIFSGWFTATESGAIACVYAFILTFFWYRDLPLSHMKVIFLKTFRTVAMVLFLIAASMAIAFILSIGLASSIVRPIKRLYQYMRKVEKGDFTDRVKVESEDELGMLSASFNKMVARLAELVEEVYLSKLRATEMHLREKESELRMLQAQINPHFLYNTLETIRGMALEHDRMDIASMSAALARIMRYNVKQTDTDVTVRQEVEIVDVYLQIQKYRFEERLQYAIDMPDWAMDQRIVKLALQPLIENSIIHGLEPGGGLTHIRLTAEKLDKDSFCILISDDGAGMSIDRLEAIRASLDDMQSDPSHIGLQNVHRRIRHLFGERYGLQVDSREGAGTVVRIVLPYADPEKELSEVG